MRSLGMLHRYGRQPRRLRSLAGRAVSSVMQQTEAKLSGPTLLKEPSAPAISGIFVELGRDWLYDCLIGARWAFGCSCDIPPPGPPPQKPKPLKKLPDNASLHESSKVVAKVG